MFLFLSKLLPLFIYPLGLACLLLIMALVMWWRRSRWTPIPISLALLILWVASSGWMSAALVRSLEWQNIPRGELPTAEAIVLLGGATKPPTPPRPMVDVKDEGDRVLYAAKLYQEQKAPIIVAAGGRIDWRDGGQSEAEDMAELLKMMGVPSRAIILEPDSLNTYENAVNVRKILEDRGIKRVLLVTSAIHMPRSVLIFQRQNFEVIPAPCDFLIAKPSGQRTTEGTILNLIPDSERLVNSTRAMKEYIGMVIYRLRGWL
ncbi:YdcF family protein [Oscillatoria salina IIICB1]|nr:YdcF family protein [Oscillatoria salina IIICB1]NET90373.1 YdcF family protein [Kamptonema sp. SIO1D9]